ncbi:hypothetical protein EDC96DRAFT_546336 [Choanephora cucurbitarum]|nr:hypothetical protein EDC96DRAFT_546336 [Choanephora cucurbitarum]
MNTKRNANHLSDCDVERLQETTSETSSDTRVLALEQRIDELKSLVGQLVERVYALEKSTQPSVCCHTKRQKRTPTIGDNYPVEVVALFQNKHPEDDQTDVLYANNGDRIFQPAPSIGKKVSPKEKLEEFTLRYIQKYTNWDLEGQAAAEQADLMYANTFFFVKEFVSTFFSDRIASGFRVSHLAAEEYNRYAAMFDLRIKKALEIIGAEKGKNALIPFHLLVNHWGSKTLIAYRIRNIADDRRKKQ